MVLQERYRNRTSELHGFQHRKQDVISRNPLKHIRSFVHIPGQQQPRFDPTACQTEPSSGSHPTARSQSLEDGLAAPATAQPEKGRMVAEKRDCSSLAVSREVAHVVPADSSQLGVALQQSEES